MKDMPITNATLTYFAKEDILHLRIAEGPEMGSFELHPDITAELNENGEIIGIEILNASKWREREFPPADNNP